MLTFARGITYTLFAYVAICAIYWSHIPSPEAPCNSIGDFLTGGGKLLLIAVR